MLLEWCGQQRVQPVFEFGQGVCACAQTGKIAGDKPLSWRRIGVVIVIVVALIAIIVLIFLLLGGGVAALEG